MIAQLAHVPRAAVAYFFVASNQHIVQFDYSSLRQAKREQPRALLRQAACSIATVVSFNVLGIPCPGHRVSKDISCGVHTAARVAIPRRGVHSNGPVGGASFSFQAKTQKCGAKAIRKVGGATTSRTTNVLEGRAAYSSLTASSPDLREDVLETRREERS